MIAFLLIIALYVGDEATAVHQTTVNLPSIANSVAFASSDNDSAALGNEPWYCKIGEDFILVDRTRRLTHGVESVSSFMGKMNLTFPDFNATIPDIQCVCRGAGAVYNLASATHYRTPMDVIVTSSTRLVVDVRVKHHLAVTILWNFTRNHDKGLATAALNCSINYRDSQSNTCTMQHRANFTNNVHSCRFDLWNCSERQIELIIIANTRATRENLNGSWTVRFENSRFCTDMRLHFVGSLLKIIHF
jgi:hypothetical protein